MCLESEWKEMGRAERSLTGEGGRGGGMGEGARGREVGGGGIGEGARGREVEGGR